MWGRASCLLPILVKKLCLVSAAAAEAHEAKLKVIPLGSWLLALAAPPCPEPLSCQPSATSLRSCPT